MTSTSQRNVKLQKAFGLFAASFALACAGSISMPHAKHHVKLVYAGRVPTAHIALR